MSRPYIYGGHPAADGAWPNVAALLVSASATAAPQLTCSAVFINAQQLLTAGHCLKNADYDLSDPDAAVGSRLHVYVGPGVRVQQGRRDPPWPPTLAVKAAQVHPLLRVHPLGYADFGLITLAEPMAGMPDLPLIDDDAGLQSAFTGGGVTLVGYGELDDRSYGRKYEVRTTLEAKTSDEALAGGSGKDACSGDSGGGALVQGDDGVWRLIGVVSRGSYLGCGSGGTIALAADASCWLAATSGRTDARCLPFKATYSDDDLQRSSPQILCSELALPPPISAAVPKPTQLETMAALQRVVHAADCSSTAAALAAATVLNLDFMQLRDLSPLATLTGLRRLSLRGNRISDLTPLHLLTSLQELDITGNMVIDTAALSTLEAHGLFIRGKRAQLQTVRDTPFLTLCRQRMTKDLARGELRTIAALLYTTMSDDCATANERLLESSELHLAERGLTQVQALSGLSNLRVLDLSGNPISDASPLASLDHLTRLDLRKTAVSDLSPLRQLIEHGLTVDAAMPKGPLKNN